MRERFREVEREVEGAREEREREKERKREREEKREERKREREKERKREREKERKREKREREEREKKERREEKELTRGGLGAQKERKKEREKERKGGKREREKGRKVERESKAQKRYETGKVGAATTRDCPSKISYSLRNGFLLGSQIIPSAFPWKVTNPKKSTLSLKWLTGLPKQVVCRVGAGMGCGGGAEGAKRHNLGSCSVGFAGAKEGPTELKSLG